MQATFCQSSLRLSLLDGSVFSAIQSSLDWFQKLGLQLTMYTLCARTHYCMLVLAHSSDSTSKCHLQLFVLSPFLGQPAVETHQKGKLQNNCLLLVVCS